MSRSEQLTGIGALYERFKERKTVALLKLAGETKIGVERIKQITKRRRKYCEGMVDDFNH